MIAHYIHNKLEEEYHYLSLWYFISFIFGIIFFFQTDFTYSIYSILIVLLALAVLSGFFRRRNLLLFFISNCLLVFAIGMLVSNIRISGVSTRPIQKVIVSELSGQVEHIKPSLRGTQVTIKDVTLNDKTQLNKIRINITSKLAAELSYGDRVKLKAKLFPLQASVLPGTYDFGFYMYMLGIEASGYALTNPEIIDNKKNFFNEYIQGLRQKIYHRLIEALGVECGNFAAAILIGETKAMPKEVAENMRNSGVAHILSVSGLHLSLVAMIFFVTSRMLLNCSNYLAYNTNIKVIAACISIIGSFLYLQISGGNIAATRAFIMTSIFIVAIMLGRTPYPLRSVMIAAFLILVFLPEYVFHPSFQLSFAAVLCLISGYEFYLRNKHILGKSKGVIASVKFYIFANIYSSFLASIVTAPFVIYHFYKFASYSVLMNLVAVPLMSFFMMPLALLSVMLMPVSLDGFALKFLGFFISVVIDMAAYIVELPAAVLVTGHISPLSLLIFTFGFFWICLWQTRWRFAGLIIMTCSLLLMFPVKKPDFIYDHTLKIVGIKNNKNQLEIYAHDALPQFVSDYWISWYGQKETYIKNQKIAWSDQLFTLPSGKTISLNYWKCSNADIQIITSKKLQCPVGSHIINNRHIWRHKQVLLYCDVAGHCQAEYGVLRKW